MPGSQAGLLRGLNVVTIDSSHDVRIGQILQQVTLRFPYLRNDHAVSTGRFIRDHKQAVFSGRTDALRDLDAWIFEDGNSPNLLLHAPAGRGKSSLLVHWLGGMKSLSMPGPPIIFLPISRRHALAKDFDFFPALATSLAPFLPEDMALPDDLEHMRSYAQHALEFLADNRTPLLIVIDGLDEADGWVLGPTFLPERNAGHPLRILVSARAEADEPSGLQWCKKLGWERDTSILQLNRLTDNDVRTLLSSAINRPLLPEVLNDCIRFCGGDPLVTQVLIQQARERGFDPNRMRITEIILDPLSRVLKDWYEHALSNASNAIKPAVHSLIAVLTQTKGPIKREELAIVMNASVGQVDEALRPVSSLVAGSISEGYAFAHQRMAEILINMLGPVDRSIDEGFLRLIQDALNRALTNTLEAHAYALRHAATHMTRLSASSQLMYDLLCPAWLAAHEARFAHLRSFVELTSAVRIIARSANVSAAVAGQLLPALTLEFAATFWGAVARECMNLRIGREPQRAESVNFLLEQVRAGLFPTGLPSFGPPIEELSMLVAIKDRLDLQLLGDWQALATKAVNDVTTKLFTSRWVDVNAGVRLIRQVNPEFNVVEHIGAVGDTAQRLRGLEYLCREGLAPDRNATLDQIRTIASSASSLALRAEAATILANQQGTTFESAFNTVLTYARTDYQSAKDAAEMVIKLLALPEAPNDVSSLHRVLECFRSTIEYPSLEAPLIAAALRRCAPNERRSFWGLIRGLPYWADICRAIEDGPEDWTKDDIEIFIRILGGRTLPPTEADIASPPTGGGAHPMWHHATGVSSVLAILMERADRPGRQTAMERTLDNLELIPPAEWWAEPGGILDEIFITARYDEGATDGVRKRVAALANRWEVARSRPLADHFGIAFRNLGAASAVTEVVDVVNRWGDKGLDKAKYHWEWASVEFITLMEAALKKVEDPALRRKVAQNLLENRQIESKQRKRIAIENELPDPEEQVWKAWIKRDRDQICHFLQCLEGGGSDISDFAVQWLLDAGPDAKGLLNQVRMPSNWTVPFQLKRRLTSVLKHWNMNDEARFPAALAAHLPASELVEIIDYILAKPGGTPPDIVGWILKEMIDPENRAVVERSYLAAVEKRPYHYRDSFRHLVTWPNLVGVITYPEEWLKCRIAHLRQYGSENEADLVLEIAHDAARHQLPALRASFSQWALPKLGVISDPVRRAEVRLMLGQAPEPDELQAGRDRFRVALANGTKSDVLTMLPFIVANGIDETERALITDFASSVTKDNFCEFFSALGDAVTSEQVYATLPIALYILSFTSAPVDLTAYFRCLPEYERDEIFKNWRRELRLNWTAFEENERRFVGCCVHHAGQAFVHETFAGILQPGIDYLPWKHVIISILERLPPDEVATFIDPVLRTIQDYDTDDLATVLISALSDDARELVLVKAIERLSSPKASNLRSWFCERYPELASGKLIDEALSAARLDARLPVGWVTEAPFATPSQRDCAWSISLDRAQAASFASALENLADAVHLLQNLRTTDPRIFHAVIQGIRVIEQRSVT